MFQLGIDVSKKTFDLCLLCEGIKGKVKTRKLKYDFNAAIAVINWLGKQHVELKNVHIIMEATSVYHESLAYGLHRAGAMISLANPYRSREFARGMGILTKNDRVLQSKGGGGCQKSGRRRSVQNSIWLRCAA